MELEGVDTLLAQNKIMQEQIQQQFEQMAKKIDSLQVAAVNASQPSTKWGQNKENQEDQQQEQPQYVHNQSSGQNEVYGDIYNPSWKNHPNIRWGDNHTQNQQPWQRNSNQNNSRNNQNHNQQNTNPNPYRKPQNNHSNSSYCPPNNQTTNQNTHHQPSTPHNQPQTSQDTQRISNLETLIEKMMKHQETMMEKLMKNQEMARQDQEAARKDQATTSKNQEASIKNLERHMEQMAKRITDASPSATQDHPRDKGKATKWEECKAIIVENTRREIPTFHETDERILQRLRREAREKNVAGEEESDEEYHELEEHSTNPTNPPVRMANNNGQPQRRVLASYTFANPRHCGSSILTPNVDANNFELKPQLITLVQNNCSYGGGPLEDPNQHLSTFLRICNTVKTNDASPSATQDHPRDKGKATKWEECKAIIVESEKKAINQEEHNREVPQEETEERSEEDQKIKNAKSSKRDKDILETQLQEKKERVKPHIPKLPYPQRKSFNLLEEKVHHHGQRKDIEPNNDDDTEETNRLQEVVLFSD
ncbi:uncharacterized protein LOC130960019 [Arachis stenosperma]|uniref:uncharacterized protein LOC130960019 n=1 Tax=Arachis stenosperma TaxID=217475 RepID=UPI0025ABF070|nr:uncharacterized protein LOC130960019 [Arachis stenosperma]